MPATRKRKLIKPACQLHFLPKHVAGPNVCDDPMSPTYRRHTLGCMDKVCRYCGALEWLDEQVFLLQKVSLTQSPVHTFPRVALGVRSYCPQDQPLLGCYVIYTPVSSLWPLTSRQTLERRTPSFNSAGAKLDPHMQQGIGNFRIYSSVYHLIGSLMPAAVAAPR